MDSWFHPSVEEIKQAVQSKGGTLTCTVCGREEYAVEEVDIMSGHRSIWSPSTASCAISVRELRLHRQLRPH